jgi:hypothetical protein
VRAKGRGAIHCYGDLLNHEFLRTRVSNPSLCRNGIAPELAAPTLHSLRTIRPSDTDLSHQKSGGAGSPSPEVLAGPCEPGDKGWIIIPSPLPIAPHRLHSGSQGLLRDTVIRRTCRALITRHATAAFFSLLSIGLSATKPSLAWLHGGGLDVYDAIAGARQATIIVIGTGFDPRSSATAQRHRDKKASRDKYFRINARVIADGADFIGRQHTHGSPTV